MTYFSHSRLGPLLYTQLGQESVCKSKMEIDLDGDLRCSRGSSIRRSTRRRRADCRFARTPIRTATARRALGLRFRSVISTSRYPAFAINLNHFHYRVLVPAPAAEYRFHQEDIRLCREGRKHRQGLSNPVLPRRFSPFPANPHQQKPRFRSPSLPGRSFAGSRQRALAPRSTQNCSCRRCS